MNSKKDNSDSLPRIQRLARRGGFTVHGSWPKAAALCATFFVLLHLPSRAQDVYTNAANGAWETAGNWSSGTTPVSTDNVFLTNGAYTVSLTDPSNPSWMTVAGLTISSTSGVGPTFLVDFTDLTKTFTVNSSVTVGGNGPFGTLMLSNGNMVVNAGTAINNIVGGHVNVAGGTLTLATGAGYGIWGGTVVLSGGVITNTWVGTFSAQTLTVTNTGLLTTSILVVGDSGAPGAGTAVMHLDGGTVQVRNDDGVNGGMFVGRSSGNVGTVVQNGGLLSSVAPIYVGNAGNGTYTLSNGVVRGVDMRLGHYGGSKGQLFMYDGTNTLSSSLSIGYVAGSTGTVSITGGNLTITNTSGTAQLVVGEAGKGTFTLNGGTVTADQLLVTNGVNSILNFSNGTLNTRASTVNNGSVFTVGNGTSNAVFSLLSGTHSFANGLIVNTNATLLISNINAASSLGAVTNQGLFNIASGSWRPGAGSVAAGSGVLRVDSGGVLDLTNGNFTVGNTVTNLGTMRMFNGTVTYNQNVVNQGAYVSDPSTNTFNGNFTVGPTATVVAAANDIYAFGSNFVMQSTNRAFNMSTAVAYFGNTNYGITTGTTNHTFDLTGSGAVDKGSNWMNVAQLATNFSIGTLSIAMGNSLHVTGGVGNALYVGTLDIGGLGTNLLGSILHLDINLYYDEHIAGNAYLNGLTYDLPGAGLLIPIPEPSALALTLVATALSVFILRRKDRRE